MHPHIIIECRGSSEESVPVEKERIQAAVVEALRTVTGSAASFSVSVRAVEELSQFPDDVSASILVRLKDTAHQEELAKRELADALYNVLRRAVDSASAPWWLRTCAMDVQPAPPSALVDQSGLAEQYHALSQRFTATQRRLLDELGALYIELAETRRGCRLRHGDGKAGA